MAKNQEIIDQIRGLLFSGDRAGIIEPTMQAAGVPGNDLGAASTPGPRFEIKPGILDPTKMTPGTGYITTGTGKNKRTEFINDKERIREPIYLDQAEAVSKLLTSMGHYGVGMDTQKTKEMLAESKMQADAHKMLMDYSPKSTILDDDGKPTAIPNEHLGLIKMVRAGTLPKYLEQAGKTATAEMDAAIQEMHKLTLPELRKQKELQGMTDVQIFEKMQPTYLRKYAQSHHEKHGEQYKKKEKK
jgi:hypothetical protein